MLPSLLASLLPPLFFGHAATPCSSRIVLRWFFQKGLDFALEGIFVHHADVQVGNSAVAIDEQRSWHRIKTETLSHDLPFPNHNRIIDFVFLQEWLDGFPAIIVQGHANGGNPALFVSVLELHVPGNFLFASRTPSGPKI